MGEKGDWEAVENLMRIMGLQSQQIAPEAMEAHKYHFVAGWGGYPLVGTAEQIVDGLQQIAGRGARRLPAVPGWTTRPSYSSGSTRCMPLLEQAGLRKPFRREA